MIFRDSMNMLESLGHETLAFNAVAKGAEIDAKYASIMDDKVVHEECFRVLDRYLYAYKQRKIKKALLSRIDVRRFDIIHSHTMLNGGWVVNRIKREYHIPYVVSVRNTDLNGFLRFPFFFPIARRIADEANAVLFLSEPYRTLFLKRVFGYSEEKRNEIAGKCYVIPNGLEDFWLNNVGPAKERKPGPIELLCVGKIDRNKNMKSILAAMGLLKERGVSTRLTVIGQILDEEVYADLQKNGDVELVPYQTKEKLLQFYRNSDIFVMPSFTESFGRVYAEAMTQGVPVIYTRNQGFDGIFPEGEVGCSVDPHDPSTIAEAILKITQNYQTVSAACIRDCRIFDWSKIAEALERMYQEALERD